MKYFLISSFVCLSFITSSQDLELIIPVGHTGVVQGMDLSPNGKFLASIDFSNEIVIWDFESRKQLFSLNEHSQPVLSIQFLNNQELVSVGADSEVLLWNVEQASTIRSFSFPGPTRHLEVDQSHLYSITPSGVIYKNLLTSGELIDSTSIDADPSSSTLYEERLIVGGADGVVRLVDLEQMSVMDSSESLNSRIMSLWFRGNYIYASTEGGQFVVFDQDFERINVFKPLSRRVIDFVIDENNGWAFVSGLDGKSVVKKISLTDGSVIAEFFQKGEYFEDQFALGSWAIEIESGNVISASPDQKLVLIDPSSDEIFGYLSGQAHPVHAIAISSNNKLAIGSAKGILKQIDLSGLEPVKSFDWGIDGIWSIDYHPLVEKMVTIGNHGVIRISDSDIITSYKAKPRYVSAPVKFDPTGQYIIRKNDQKYIDLYEYQGKKQRKIKSKDGYGFDFSTDGTGILVRTSQGITIFETSTLKRLEEVPIKNVQDFDTFDNGFYVLLRDDQTLQEFNKNGRRLRSFPVDDLKADKIVLHPNGKYAFAYQSTVAKGQTTMDYSIAQIDLVKGEVVGRLTGHNDFISQVEFFEDGNFIFSSSYDGKINIYETGSFKPAASIISLGASDYVVVTPDGLYDATQRAMESMHYEKDGNIILLDQFKNSFYEPNLLPRLLGLIDDPLPNRTLGSVLPHPELNITHPNLNDGILGIQVEDNGGGIGEVVIIINGKEVSRDARDIQSENSGFIEFDYQIAGHPYLKGDGIDRVVIKAYNKDGTMSTSEKSISVFPESRLGKIEPRLFAIVAGASDYGGDDLDLNFAAKDAEDFAKVLQTSAGNQFGEENVQIHLLTTDKRDGGWPSKSNLDSIFNGVAKEASALDYLVIYLSGHGVNEDDFYYLTADASDATLEDFDKSKVAISSGELTEMIKRVPALQQVLILDACHSGRVANELLQSSSIPVMESERIKAMERMKDRTGLYVLAGSKADAVSYEADLFKQGLLTYSILFGMKGAAFEDEIIDVIDLFQFVQDKVPELAADIGGIQKPEIRYPANAESFSLGTMTEEDQSQVQLVDPKPIFTISSFQDDDTFYDPMRIGSLVDDRIEDLSDTEELVFLNKTSFTQSYFIRGRYKKVDEILSVRARLFKGETRIASFTVEGMSPDVIAEEIVNKALRELD